MEGDSAPGEEAAVLSRAWLAVRGGDMITRRSCDEAVQGSQRGGC